MTTTVKAYAAFDSTAPLAPHTIQRRQAKPTDVVIEIKFAGICHSDIHQVRQEWGPREYPMVPGHEIGGVVSFVGPDVQKFAVGDVVGVGCMVDSCRTCKSCRTGEEQYCLGGCVGTYADKHRYPHCAEYTPEGGAVTQGGYSQRIVVDQLFVVKIPTNLDLAAATPLLCAGITTFSPLMHFGLRPSHRIAIMGLGGLGHMGVKFGVAFGAHVTVISRGQGKRADALGNLGAHDFLDSTNADALKAAAGTFDFILDTVSAQHDLQVLIGLLATDGTLCLVGAPPTPYQLAGFGLIMGRKRVCGSGIGGIKETQDMLNFCGRHNITCDIELINASYINTAYERTMASDVKYRFVIDTATL